MIDVSITFHQVNVLLIDEMKRMASILEKYAEAPLFFRKEGLEDVEARMTEIARLFAIREANK